MIKWVLIIITLFSVIRSNASTQFFLIVDNSSVLELEYKKGKSLRNHPLKRIISQFDIISIDKPFKTIDENLQHTYLVISELEIQTELLNQSLKTYSYVEYVEEVPEYHLFLTPNDPLFNQQWHLSTIQAEQAWNISVGSSNVVIAVVDDAVRLDHEDLAGAIFQNPNETLNGFDDDGNGFIDDINGWDAADNDNDANPPLAAVTSSYFTHGTHVAGIAASVTNNNIGVASISFGAKILPVKIKESAAAGPGLQAAIQGVDYAVASGYADVVNMSFGGSGFSQTFQNLFDAGHAAGITFVAAAGNSNTNAPMFPASYNHVISVGATDPGDAKASFSNYGATIDVMAPGRDILSSIATSVSAYDEFSGTSMASPLTAGLCAVMIAYSNPEPDEIEQCLKNTCDNVDAQNTSFIGEIGAGRINALQALGCLTVEPFAYFSANDTVACPGQVIQFEDESLGATPMTWSWQFPGGTPSTSTQQNPLVSYASLGTYTVTLTITNPFGSSTETITNYITIEDPTAVISGSATIIPGASAYLRFDFTGNPPFSFSFTDGSNVFNESNIISNPFYLAVSPADTTTYTLKGMEDNFCDGLISGVGYVAVADSVAGNCLNLIVNGDFAMVDNATCVPIGFSSDMSLDCMAPTAGIDFYHITPITDPWNGIQWAGYTDHTPGGGTNLYLGDGASVANLRA